MPAYRVRAGVDAGRLRRRRWRCPDCAGEFVHSYLSSEPDCPERCPLCDAWVSDEAPPQEVFVPAAPGIRKSAFAKSVDQTYRAMEESSRHRADEAADTLETAYRADPLDGEDSGLIAASRKEQIAQMKSELKITNMRDPSDMREGDAAAITDSAAAQRLSIGPSRPGFQQLGGAPPPNHAPGVGNYAVRDAVTSGINAGHASRAQALVSAGNMGTYKP